jgi:hypothetical protein
MLYVIDLLLRPIKNQVGIDHRLYWLIIAFIVIQTVSSLIGLFVAPGRVIPTSEIYYLIQRSSFLMIPLLALRYNLSPQSVLKVFMGAVFIHYVFIAFQFVSPDGYGAFVEYVNDPFRGVDSSRGWSRETMSLNFVGIQRTANYGTFAAAFGLLMLAFTPNHWLGWFLKQTVVFLSLFMVLSAPSRATFLMTMIALLIFCKQTWLSSNLKELGVVFVATIVASQIAISAFTQAPSTLTSTQPPSTLTSRVKTAPVVHSFVDPAKRSSNEGKLMILKASPKLIAKSPFFGWGQRRFTEVTRVALGSDAGLPEYTHFFVLTTILSSGLIGLMAYIAVFAGIARALWRRKEQDYGIVAGMFIGLGVYNIVYDAGHLDLFACFNGIAAYYALRSQVTTPAAHSST